MRTQSSNRNQRTETVRIMKSSLALSWRAFLDFMQRITFGEIINFKIENGEPVFSDNTTYSRHIKFGCDNAIRPELFLPDYALKQKHIDMYKEFQEIRNGTVASLKVSEGLPTDMKTIENALAYLAELIAT